MHICKFCGREGKSYKSNWIHESRCKFNPSRIKIEPWNKGLVGDSRCAHSDETKKKLQKCTGKGKTPEKEAERIRKITEKAKQNNGGFRQGSGRGKKGWYKGVFCASSWELAFVVYHIDHNFSIHRCNETRWYLWEGKQKRYYPDFIVDGKIIEIKGYRTKQWEAKLIANPDVTVLYKNDMKPYLDYVISKYGKDFIKLYGG